MIAECQGGGGGDLLIKLFGRTIPVPESGDAKDLQQSSSNSTSSTEQENEHAHPDTPDPSPQPEVVDAEDPAKSSPDQTHQKPGHGDGNSGDAASQREKLRKPDKVLPCPRCNSMDTKFCYFNNYNVNQPRHFCKNCQRYWTAGGAMRNVPVGAGRRKNKHAAAASHFLQRVRAATAAGDPLRGGCGTVLSFAAHGHGHGAPPALHDLAEQVNHLKEKLLIPSSRNAGGDNPPPAGPCSEGSSSSTDDDMTTHHRGGGGSIKEQPSAGAPPQHPASMNGAAVWPYTCAAPSPAYFSSGIAIPVYPAAPGYWGCMVPAPGAWSLPWQAATQPPPSQQGLSSPTSTAAPSVSSSGADSLALGKHPRDREVEEGIRTSAGHGGGGGKVWAPKTIRIDDADEVARSSIWSLIGIKGGDSRKQESEHGVGHKHGTVFEPKLEAKKAAKPAMITSSPPLLHMNPVALTRSVTFQEGS